jgi:hypothetical protein
LKRRSNGARQKFLIFWKDVIMGIPERKDARERLVGLKERR